MSPENQALLEKYPQYYRNVAHLEVIDVYRVIQLFNVTDATAQHALKKLLLSGSRTGGKSIETDLKEARDTLTRGLAMRAEDDPQLKLEPQIQVRVHGVRGPDALLAGFGVGVQEQTFTTAVVNGQEYPVPAVPPSHAPWQLAQPQQPTEPAKFCTAPDCMMRARVGDHCMIHALPPEQPAPPAPPAPAPVIMCAEPSCVMIPVNGSTRCAEHEIIPPFEVYRHKPWCTEKGAAKSCPCQDAQDPAQRTPTITVPPGPSAPPARCR